jgi:hypothetical protein
VPDIDGPTHAYLGANAGCWAAWGDLQARAMTDLHLARWQPLAVDAYAAQHPGVAGRRQAQSVIVHLASICLVLERGFAPADGIRAKQLLLARDPVFDWLEPPASPGSITVLDAAAASGANDGAVVQAWAASVWEAWAAHHAFLRATADRAARHLR